MRRFNGEPRIPSGSTFKATGVFEHVISAEGLQVLGLLSRDERRLMRELVRIAKSKRNVFPEGKLADRKACRGMNLPSLLHSLANKGLTQPVRSHVWATTKLGRELAHYLEEVDFEAKLGYTHVRR